MLFMLKTIADRVISGMGKALEPIIFFWPTIIRPLAAFERSNFEYFFTFWSGTLTQKDRASYG